MQAEGLGKGQGKRDTWSLTYDICICVCVYWGWVVACMSRHLSMILVVSSCYLRLLPSMSL